MTGMKSFLAKLAERVSDLAQTQPLLAFFVGAALVTVFVSTWLRLERAPERSGQSLSWTIYQHGIRVAAALLVVLLVASTLALLRIYLGRSVAHFQRFHGRITEANYNSVRTIWGPEQTQRDLAFTAYYDEEITERIESEDLTKPAVLRKKTVRQFIPGNAFLSERHEITLTQNPRRKGSALYGGYETRCDFTWKLHSPANRNVTGLIRFPLPGHGAILDDLVVTLNGKDVLSAAEIHDSALVINRDLGPGEQLDVRIAFSSRGMACWYFQVQESRAIQDFRLTLNLPDLARAKLNYPEGCMSPTEIRATDDRKGTILHYRLDHALSHKGMGLELPRLAQPGALTSAVLAESERAWMLVTAVVLLALTFAGAANGAMVGVLFAAAVAFGYTLLADFSDLLFGFWGTAALVLAPLLAVAAWILRRMVGGRPGNWVAAQMLIFGVLFPAAAGLDPIRNTLYLNLCALVLLVYIARQSAAGVRPAAGNLRMQAAQ